VDEHLPKSTGAAVCPKVGDETTLRDSSGFLVVPVLPKEVSHTAKSFGHGFGTHVVSLLERLTWTNRRSQRELQLKLIDVRTYVYFFPSFRYQWYPTLSSGSR
jgi:hypothetical protein